MAGLLYREMILNKKSLGMMAAGEFVMSFMIILPLIYGDDFSDAELVSALFSVLVFFMMFLVLGVMTANFFEIDEVKKWVYFISSTPLTGTGQIGAKYLFILLIYIGLFLYCYFLAIFTAVFGGAANLLAAFEMAWIMILANAIEFPFLVRFGCRAGSYVKMFMGLLFILISFEFIFFGDISAFASPDKFFGLLERFSDVSEMADISIVIIAALPFLGACLYYFSYKISCKLYLKGAEEYD